MDNRPANCRFRLKDEGLPYPRSGCTSCGWSIFKGKPPEGCDKKAEGRPDPASGVIASSMGSHLIATRTDLNRLWYIEVLAKDAEQRSSPEGPNAALLRDIAARFEILLEAGSPNNYAEEPISLTQHKAEKSSKAEDWTPRDAVVDVLRKMDKEGSPPVTEAIVVWRQTESDGSSSLRFSNSVGDMSVLLGMLSYAQHKAFEGGMD